MPVPKRKTGRSKTHSRRSTHTVDAPTLNSCPQCRAPKLPHRVCPSCGYYDGREVVETE